MATLTLVAPAVSAASASSWAAPASADGTTPDSDGIGIRIVDVPKAEVNNPRARAYIIDQLSPATTIKRHVEVSNTSSVAQHVSLYASGASVVDNVFSPAADNDLSSWTSVTPSTLVVPAHSALEALVTVAVPETATRGEKYAAVWAQVEKAGSGSNPVKQVNRVGIRLYVLVDSGGMVPPKFTVGTISVVNDPGKTPVLTALLTNTGQRAVDLVGSLTMSSANGTVNAGPYRTSSAVTLLPSHSAPALITLGTGLGAGVWEATLVVADGDVTRTVTGRVTLGADTSDFTRDHSSTTSRWLIMGGIAVGVLVVLLLVLVLLRRRKRVVS